MQKKKEIDLDKSSRFRYLDWEKIKTFYYVAIYQNLRVFVSVSACLEPTNFFYEAYIGVPFICSSE